MAAVKSASVVSTWQVSHSPLSRTLFINIVVVTVYFLMSLLFPINHS